MDVFAHRYLASVGLERRSAERRGGEGATPAASVAQSVGGSAPGAAAAGGAGAGREASGGGRGARKRR